MANIQLFGSYSDEDQKKDKKTAEDSKGSKFWKPTGKRSRIRVLPPAPGTKGLYAVVYQHFMKNEAQNLIRSFNCPRKTNKGNLPCPACAIEDKLKSTGQRADKDLANTQFRSKLRAFANIIDLDNEDDGVQVYAFGVQVYEQLVELAEERNFWDPTRGCELIIKKKGEGRDTEYSILPGNDHAISDAEVSHIIGGMSNLQMIAGGVPDVAEINATLAELDLDGEPEPAPPPRRTTRPAGEPAPRRASAKDAVAEGELEDNPFGD